MNTTYLETTYDSRMYRNKESVSSINPCHSVIQTINETDLAHRASFDVATELNSSTRFNIKIPNLHI